MAVQSVSTTPYEATTYSATSNDKNTLSIESYIQLLATQLQNQDVTNPMDSSEMMNQLTQMAMVQALSTLTTTMTNSSAIETTNYAAGLIGKGVTVAQTEESTYGASVVVGSKYGKVASVNLSGSDPTFRLEGDSTDYSLTQLMGIGDLTQETETADEESSEVDETEEEEDSGTTATAYAASYTSKLPTEGETETNSVVSLEEKNLAATQAELLQEQLRQEQLVQAFYYGSDKDDEDDGIDLSFLM